MPPPSYVSVHIPVSFFFFFFFNDTATTEIYTLSLHDALPISPWLRSCACSRRDRGSTAGRVRAPSRCTSRGRRLQTCSSGRDRKSTRLNSSHSQISYAVFCLKKKKTIHNDSVLSIQYSRFETI